METRLFCDLDQKLHSRKKIPPECQIELTYRCQFDCVHCYCKGLENKKKELSTCRWKEIIDELQRAGCLWLAFTGGDPLVREDFLELYAYARERGFLVSILTNGFGLNKKIIRHFVKSPPYSIAITVNGATRKIYERVTRTCNSFGRVRENIRLLRKAKLLLYIKTNCLTINIHEIARIKRWVDRLLRPKPGQYFFSYDPIIFPRLNGDRAPCAYRIAPSDRQAIVRDEPDLKQDYCRYLAGELPCLERPREFLYQCTSWEDQCIITPYGRLQFCLHAEKLSVDLSTISFTDGIAAMHSLVRAKKFKTQSKCKSCAMRAMCNWCPAKALLETGNEESPVDYYCAVAAETIKQDRDLKHEKRIIS